MLLFLALAAVLAVMLLFPRTPMGEALHRLLVETAIRRLARIRPGHLLFAVALAGAGLALFTLFEIEGLRLFAFMAPEIVVWFGLFDIALVLDVLALVVAMAVTARLRAVRDQSIAWARRVATGGQAIFRAAGRPRSRHDRPSGSRPSRSDDPDPFGLGQPLVFAG